jgi:hypothetical protein
MTHSEARELLELAAAEPHGFERLAAGDTSESGMLAGHLAGCDACREEYDRLERTAGLLHSNLSTLPPVDLRERTLARVAAEGHPRGAPQLLADRAAASEAPAAVAPVPIRLERRMAVRWIASLAAALVVAAGLGWAIVARPLADEARRSTDTANALVHLTAVSIAVNSAADARHVVLASTSGAAGSLAYSPSTRELVVVSTGLREPTDDAEYRCWVEANGQRTQLGDMYFVGGIAAWEGSSPAVASVPPGATFGISLAPGGGGEAVPVMTGTLGGT